MKIFNDSKAILLWLSSLALSSRAYILQGSGDISLFDVETEIDDIQTIFTEEDTKVTVSGLEWDSSDANPTTLTYETFVNGKSAATGEIELVADDLPDSIEAGVVQVGDRGTATIRVELTSGDSSAESSRNYQAFGNGVAIIPLLVVLGLAVTTRMVEFSLFAAIFVGACMVEGTVIDGFKESLENYILGAVADAGHAYVVLFSLFLSGLVGMMEKSGGMLGFTKDIARYATGSRSGQLCAFAVGCFVFFDDYANTLLAGETMRPLLDSLFVSREKLAFIVDATAAPIASISPVSSWVGFEIGLIQDEIDRIIEREGEENLRIKTSGMAVFLQSIKYRYYPIFMIILMVSLISVKRDFGPMLVAERKTQVYKRTDGGNGKGKNEATEGTKANQPEEDTPVKSWNMITPVLLLVFFIFYLLIKSGEVEGEDQSIMDKIEGGDSYVALLWGTMAAAICSLLLYSLQVVRDGDLVGPSQYFPSIVAMFKAPVVEGESKPRLLMNLNENVESFLYGMARIFPAIIVLNLAWAVGSTMKTVGADRLFARWILGGGISAEALPTLSFLISFFMALATGTSWGTMTILFPMVLVPTHVAASGDPTIFYATTAGILSGSVAGDHVSPISDTTVLSSLACDCNLLAHVSTQMPYALVVSLVAILVGTVPIGFDAWPNIIGILIGAGLIFCFAYFFCAPVLSPSGRYDYMTELYLMVRGGDELLKIKEDTVKAYNGEEVSAQKNMKMMEDSEESSHEKAEVAAVEEGEVVHDTTEAEA